MAKKKINNYVFRPGMSYLGNLKPNAYASILANREHLKKELSGFINRRVTVDTAFQYYPEAIRLLTSNRTYMQYEVVAWIQNQVANNIAPFVGYTYDTAKCLRDTLYNIDAYIHDLRYGGNEETRKIAGFYWIGSTPQIDGPRTPETAAYAFLRSLINNYILTRAAAPSFQGTYSQYTTGPSAESQVASKVTALTQITIDVITNGLSSLPAIQYKASTYENYTYSVEKCERDFGFVIDAYLNDLRYDGTEDTTRVVKLYYDGDTLQVDGSGQAEVEAHRFIRERINSNIIQNVVGTEDYTEAVRLLTENKTYLQYEVTAWIQDQIDTAAKCVRDIGFLIDGVQYDVVLGTNYNAVFLGLAEYNSLDNDFIVLDTIRRAGLEVAGLTAVAASTAATTRATTFFNEVRDIATNGRTAADVITFTNPTSATASQIAAKDKLIANKNFLAAEVNAWVADTYPLHDHDEAKCTRDVKYAIDAICYDILYGGNSATYDQAKFFFYGFASGAPGIDPTHRLQTVAAYGRLKTIIAQVVQGVPVIKTTTGSTPNTLTQVTSGANASSGDATTIQTLVQITADVVNATTQTAANLILASIPRTLPNASWAPAALQNAQSAIAAAKTTIVNSVVDFNGFTYDQAKCIRDAGYVIDAYIYDLRYNGNEETYRVTTKYYYGNEIQVDGDRYPEAYAHTFLRNTINNYILPRIAAPSFQSIYTQVTTSPSAESGATSRITTLSNVLINLLLDGTGSLPAISYRTVPYQTLTPQVVTSGLTPETGAAAKIVELSNILLTLIPGGLSVLAAPISSTYGRLKIQGKYTTDDFLLITNTSTNTIIYNFSNNETGGTIEQEVLEDEDFVKFLQTTDGVTSIKLNYNTSSMSSEDDIQIFVENSEQTVRPYDFGTDAIERHRVATPQSMLDADFEYGLQPTKWQAIAVARGYPSIYEIPGTDQDVTSISSDASAGTGGVGGSLITVTTNSSHGFSVGTPVTVRGLTQSIPSVSRAEGSFVITAVPSNRIFSYYAKARVGTANPTELSTTFAQIRQGGFYTGAEIGTPVFTVTSNGTSGTLSTAWNIATSSNRIAFTGTAPELGAPITGTGLGVGSQVTSILGTGGVVVTPFLTADYPIGTTVVSVSSTSSVQVGLGVSDGSGTATFVTEINGLDLTLSRPLAAAIKGNTVTYSGISGTNVVGIGTSATFDITRDNTITYSSIILNTPGTDYAAGDTIKILGTALGGASTANDLYLNVEAIGGGGSIVGVSVIEGVANPVANQTITGIDNTVYTTAAAGTGAVFQVTRSGSAYTAGITTAGSNYSNSETFTVPGTVFTLGASPANDVTITVSQVANSYTSITQDSTTGAGSAAEFSISRNGTVYSVTLTNPGSAYIDTEALTIFGTQLGGASPANDLTINVVSTTLTGGIDTFTSSGNASNLSGAITEIAVTGTGAYQVTYTNVGGSNVAALGTSAEFTVTRTGSTYSSITVSNGGTNYRVGNKILLSGTSLGGASPTNDVELTVGTVSTGAIVDPISIGTHIASAGFTFALYSSITVSEFTTAVIPQSTTLSFAALATIRVDFLAAHGIPPGGAFIVVPTSDNGVNNHTLAGGSYAATSIPTATSLSYQARAAGTITGTITGRIYARPDSFFTHRPFDGGVQLGTGGPQHGVQAVRQSKKYIRYQSGKGIMYTTGALFAPSYDIQNIVAEGVEVGSVITITLDENDHGFQIGAKVRITGVETPGYDSNTEYFPDSDYTVTEVVSERVFRVTALRRLGSKIPTLGFSCQVSTLNWKGAVVRAGAFDDQNGMFWEYNGDELAVVQRSSTKQLAGTITAVPGSNTIIGTNSRFLDQLKAGDFVVVKGMTHVITTVASDTSITVNPDFRGVSTVTGSKICLVTDKRVPQREFNRDRLDGTGPSGYKVDITKMQMIGIQYTWYGAGFIDFMLRGSDGNFVFAHRMRNSNVNSEAFMRTGNLPVRYEVANYGAVSRLTSDISASVDTLPVESTEFFPDSGVVYVDNELISYTGKTATTLTGAVRSSQLSNFQSGALRSYRAGIATSHTQKTGVILLTNTTTPLISHWGSAFLTDGRFDEDRGYLFSYTSTGNSISTTKRTVFLIRLAPSVSNAVVGDLGERELLNRAQLLLNEISIASDTGTGGIVVEGVLNPQNYPLNPGDITWGRLSGLAQGGQPSFAQIAPGGSVNWAGGGSYTFTTATALNTITGNATVPTGAAFNRGSGTTIAYVTRTSWDGIGAVVGQAVTDAKFPSGTTVTARTLSPTPTATTLPLLVATAQSVFNIGSGSNVLYFSQASWAFLQGSTIATDIFTNDTSLFANGTFVTAVTGPSGGFYTVSFNSSTLRNWNNNSTTAFRFAGARAPGNTIHFFQQASWAALPVDVIAGQTTNDGKFTGGTQISSVSTLRTFAGTSYFAVTFNAGNTSTVSAGGTVTFNTTLYYTLSFSRASTSAVNNTNNITFSLAQSTANTSTIYFTQASWEASGAAANTEIATTETKFPAGTRVQSVSTLQTFASTTYYTVTFTQTTNAVIAGGNTVQFQFGNPPYALPGETIFSFITNPGSTDALNLSSLKELTTTALGGRGTFPNGPDVLAINVYKVSGAAVPANIILRWSEAQA
jgi:hypothetical protein